MVSITGYVLFCKMKESIKNWLQKTRSLRHDIYEVMIWIVGIGLVVYYLVGCASYIGPNPCPHFCSVEHKHKMHSEDYDCKQAACIHMLKKA